MLLTVFLAVIVCASMTVMLVAAVAFVQNEKFFSSAPKEAREVIKPREKELFYGARAIGWVLMAFSLVMIIGAVATAIWDGFRSDFTFWQFFIRFVTMFTIYKVFDMVFFDYFFLMKFKFFQYYYPETDGAFEKRKYGFNIVSQLVKLLVVFPAVSALAAWICTLF